MIPQSRKGQSDALKGVPATAIAFIVVAVVFVVGYIVLAGMQTNLAVPANLSQATSGQLAASGAIGNMTSGMNNIVTFAPTWGTVIGAAVILSIVVGGLYYFMRKQSM